MNNHMIYFAAVGDVHGAMHLLVEQIEMLQNTSSIRLEFVLQVGDFQPVRDENDLTTMNIPAKYRKTGDFPCFADKGFPWPIWFIGGNHEPYGYLDHYPQGGELAPNCHYLGRSGHMELCGLKLAWISGIYSSARFNHRRPPVNEICQRSNKEYSCYNLHDIETLLDASIQPDVLLMHDWPDPTEPAPYGFSDIRRAERSNPYGGVLTELLKPEIVLCGHMHHPHEFAFTDEDGSKTRICCLPQLSGKPSLTGIELFSFIPGTGVRKRDKWTGKEVE